MQRKPICNVILQIQRPRVQGLVLGPLLFILYVNDLVNDIPDLVESKIKMFADDIKIYTQITSFREALTLQNDLDKLCDWSKEWLLRFS